MRNAFAPVASNSGMAKSRQPIEPTTESTDPESEPSSRQREDYWMLNIALLLCPPATVSVNGIAAPAGAVGGTRKLIW